MHLHAVLSLNLLPQAGMANSLKQMLEVMKGNAAEQTAGVGRIVDKFTQQMHAALDTDFRKLGNVLKNAGEAQAVNTANITEMSEIVKISSPLNAPSPIDKPRNVPKIPIPVRVPGIPEL